jgi:hypothetical protein
MPSFAPLPPAPAMPPLAPVPPVAAQPSLSAMPVAQPSLGQPSAPPAAAPAAPAPPRAVVALDLGDFGSSPASPSSSAAAAVSSSAHPTPAGYAVDARVEENARQLAKGQVATDVKLGATLGGRILVLVGAALVVLANLWAIAVIIGVDAAFTLEALAGAAIATVAGVVLRIVGWTWWTFVAARNARRVAKKPTVSPAFGPVVYGLIVELAVMGWVIHWGFFVLSSLTYLFGYVAVNKQFSRSGAVIGGGSEGFQTLNRILGLQVLATVVCNILARVSGGSTVVAVLTIVSWCALAAWETVVAQRAFRQFDAACRQPLQPVSFSGDVDLATFLARNNISRTAESYHQS